MTDVSHQKAELRRIARARRRSVTDGPDRSRRIAAFAGDLAPEPRTIAGYWPKGTEADVRFLMERLEEAGHRLALPVMAGVDAPLIFRAWALGEELEAGPFHVQQPLGASPEVVPDMVLLPLLAFDSQGWRLGYGGGFYDRTLEELRRRAQIRCVGVGFDAQQVPEVPRGDFDQRLDGVLTETGLVWVERQ